MQAISVINRSKHDLPQYETSHSAGMDIRANIDSPVVLAPMQRALIKNGVFVELPKGFEVQVRPRRGLAYKKGITVLDSPGTIDADYRGEVGVLLVNLSDTEFVVHDGERIAQVVIAQYQQADWKVQEILTETERGQGGFGSTGTK